MDPRTTAVAHTMPAAVAALPSHQSGKTHKAILAGGCFWGVEYQLRKLPGVLDVISGYTGGHVDHPTYEQVCDHNTGHAEAVEVVYDPAKVDFRTIAKRFFETHDPTQVDGQGPDIGDQYRSEVFVLDQEQWKVSMELIDTLRGLGYAVVTRITPASTFWPAEDYHQRYYERTGKQPYCHVYRKRFPD